VPVVALLSLLKPLWELSLGQALFSNTFWPNLPEAHLLGLAAGLGYALWIRVGTGPFRPERSGGPLLGAALSPPKPGRGTRKVLG
jgi:hypothetical protein